MAVINTTFGFVFVHVPKSAGTSVTWALSKLCTVLDLEIGGSAFGESIQSAYRERHGISKHSSAHELRGLLGEQAWVKYVSFGVVRHPLARLASAFRFLRQWDSPSNRAHEGMSRFGTFADFVASDVWIRDDGPDRMFRPQSFWLADRASDRLLVDRFLHVESLDAGLRQLLLDVGVPRTKVPEKLPQLNATRRGQTAYALSEDLMSKVEERYRVDLRMFGYNMPPAKGEDATGNVVAA